MYTMKLSEFYKKQETWKILFAVDRREAERALTPPAILLTTFPGKGLNWILKAVLKLNCILLTTYLEKGLI